MNWLRSPSFQVLPPSSERYKALCVDSIMAYTTLGLDGATATAMRPQGLAGRPDADFSSKSFHVAPPSLVTKNPLPLGDVGLSPPERKVQPLRRKSHIPAYKTLGSCELMEIMEQPVERLAPFKILFQVFPPSVVLYKPRSSLSLQSLPGTQAYTVLLSLGFTIILEMRSEFGR